jgi:SAM-dependent methyltransferase
MKLDVDTQNNLIRDEGLERRSDYGLAPPQDRFIVQLLKRNIDKVLATYAVPRSTQPRALDVGCGSQPFRDNIEALGYKYVSVDVHQNPEKTVDIICEIDRALPPELTDLGGFDFILCTEVMEHVVDWDTSFSNFSKLLAPGGRLFITCPHLYPLHEVPYDFWRATPYALQYFGNKYKIEVIHQVNAGDAWDVLGTVLATFNASPISRKISDRIFSRLVSYFQKWLLELLLSGNLQKSVSVHGSFYQANIIVFEK